jgi:5-methyltetrahydropteroyltriglutamate--homocysteine methyltransferase
VLRSDGRILTTHAGSLPRPRALTDLFVRASRGEAVDAEALEAEIRAATERSVAVQRACGIDVGNDGEQGRESFFTYVRNRMTGFGGKSQRPVMRDLVAYPGFFELMLPHYARGSVSLMSAPKAIAAVRYGTRAALDADLARFAAASAGNGFAETFWTVPSPGIVACAMENEHYPSLDAYVDAVAAALATEYEAVVAAGHVLQIDAPDLAMERHTYFADRPLEDFVAFVERVGDLLNAALATAPQERIRLHVCWGNYEGPHDEDVALADVWSAIRRIRCGALLLSMANPRHAHEYRIVAGTGLAAGTALVAGVIDTTTNYIEHPDVIADRLEQIAHALGDPSRLMAGTDCGFETSAGFSSVVDEIAWQKLAALVEGARRAEHRLFG